MYSKKKLDYELAKLKKKGIFDHMEIVLVSPEFFASIRRELGAKIVLQRDRVLSTMYFTYQEAKVFPNRDVTGNLVVPYFCNTKVS